jgi:hypothetical protein
VADISCPTPKSPGPERAGSCRIPPEIIDRT